ncbi:MAG: MASE1 domain-containing protein [Vicinamibacterales bacterium]
MTARLPRRAVFVAHLAALTLAYYLAGRLGLSMAFLNASASPIWPPTGIAVAALLLFGRQLWPGVAAGAFFVNLSVTGSVWVASAIALGNTLEAWLGAYLVERFARGAQSFERARDVFLFVVAAGVIAPVVSASIGVSVLTLAQLSEPGAARLVWVTWWMGDALGAVLYAPALILLWTDRRPRTRLEQIEGLVVVAALVVLAAAVFRFGGEPERGSYPLGFLCIPLALWPAFRVGQRETAIAAVALSIVAVWGTLGRYGPYATDLPNRGLLLAQTFAGVVAVTTAAMAALVGERQRLYDQLERRVSERTDQLKLTNQELHAEIGARERVQGALRSSESRLLEAQALAHVGSWEWDVDADQLRWSDEVYRIYGVEREHFDVSYQSFLAMVHRDDRTRLEQAVRDALATGGFFEVEHRIVRPDGTERTVAGRGRTVCDADDRPILMLGTELDITERQRGEEQRRELADALSARRQAEAASRMKDEFLAIVSHELRTPLNAILGWAHMLGAGSLDGAGHLKALKIIERNALMQARLIDDLLDVSRFATGQAVVHAAPVAIGGILTTAVEAIEPSAAARRVVVALTMPDPTSVVDGDPARLQQIMSNLLSNAVKFTPEGGRVSVEVVADATTVSITVSDSGRGIAAQDLPRVFEPFWQVDTTLTRTDGGLGLGLAIVRSLVEAHAGTVRVESDGLGRGARFIVELPRSLSALPDAPLSRS